MSCTNFGVLKRICSATFLQSYRKTFDISIKKLHYFQIRVNSNYASKNCFKEEFCYRNTSFLLPSLYQNANLMPARFNTRSYSRWSKCPQSSASVNSSSRKKHRYKDLQFAEKMRHKLYFTKLRAKRRVTKTIVEIKENILTVPNGLCVLRILSTPVLGYLVISEFYTASLGLFIVAGFTDLIDGFIARSFPSQQTMIGSFLDPAADKLLIATLFITLTVKGLIPVPLTTLIILRDACLFGAGFYIRYVSLPPPKTLSRYFDMSFVTARLSPTNLSKVNTFLQLCLVAGSLSAPVFNYVDHLYLHILWYITGTTTVLSAASYVYYNHSTYKVFLKDSKK
ncbi:probable cardiolipin synthase (CMP-forming) [Uloborus diversus]|uniref:probable cardiolipin synthase (CMP-forming) n=1 Tax=Uloborus diversus TaxID=327109 RepID=UPI0024091A4A|nr:probable cardiolipin synthase (CMP-forming) [Uloborus diversus]